MPFLVAAVLVIAVHLATAVGAWTGVDLLADDHQMVGGAVLRHRGVWSLAQAFSPAPPPAGADVALYRPFIDLLFWLEQPWFGIEAFGYHVTNSVLHCATALLWFVLVRRWTDSVFAATATAVLFVGWPGHSEAVHWIAARTNVSSTCMLSLALLLHDLAGSRCGLARWGLAIAAAAAAVVAVGCKESAVFVLPLAATVSWLHGGHGGSVVARALRAGQAMLPMAIAVCAWLAWRAHCLQTWGSGANYGWKAQRVGIAACFDWLRVLLAPAHAVYVPPVLAAVLLVVSIVLFALAAAALRQAASRTAAAPAAVVLALGYLAGIGLERLDVRMLENVRYTYEAALGIAVLFALGLASLPPRVRIAALAATALLHAFVLDANRRSWLRVSAVYTQLRDEVVATARKQQAPLRVFDAPGVHDGAFGFLNSTTEFLFWRETAPPGTNLAGNVTSAVEWYPALRELAAAAEQKQLPATSFVVRWTDGGLVPLALDAQWPQQPWPGARIAYARIARERPFVGTEVPVQVLLQVPQAANVRAVVDRKGAQRVVGAATPVAPGVLTPVDLRLPMPVDAAADAPLPIALHVELADGRAQTWSLGVVVPAAR